MLQHLVKLQRNGNAITVAIPRKFLVFNRWEAGTYVGVELQNDGSIHVRKPVTSDFVGSTPTPPTSHELTHVEPQGSR